MGQGEEALMAFQETNPAHYKRFPNLTSWLLFHLTNKFHIEAYLREVQEYLENGALKEAQRWILEKLVRHFERHSSFRNDEDREMTLFYFEGHLNWFLEYERGILAYGELSRGRKRLWQQMRYVFELDTCIENDENNEGDEDDEDVENDEIESDSETDLKYSNERTSQAVVQGLQSRIKRDIDKAKVFEEVRFPSMELPNIGSLNRHEILGSIISKARQDLPRFDRLFEEVDAKSIENTLERNLNPAVRAMCENGLFDIKQ